MCCRYFFKLVELMKAEIISIGDEMTSGQRLDTNSQWIAQQLTDLAIEIVQMTTVGDQMDVLVKTFRESTNRADLVVCTGGIGPTEDDLTRQAFAEVAGRELLIDDLSLQHIKRLFAIRGRTMTQNNVIQAMIPEGATAIPNEHGTAPGIDMLVDTGTGSTTRMIALPGVPYEMKDMWTNTIFPSLQTNCGTTTRYFYLHCFGAGESELSTRLPGLIDRGRIPRVGITASKATITFRISVEGESYDDCEGKSRETVDLIRSELGELVFGDGEQTLESVVVDMLHDQDVSVAILDVALDGLPQLMLQQAAKKLGADITGMTFANVKHVAQWLEHNSDHPAPDFYTDQFLEDVVRALADDTQTDIAIAVIPGNVPAGADESEKCTVGIRLDGETVVFRFRHLGHEDLKYARAAKMVLNQLRLRLISRPAG